jgi:hypothetical protein
MAKLHLWSSRASLPEYAKPTIAPLWDAEKHGIEIERLVLIAKRLTACPYKGVRLLPNVHRFHAHTQMFCMREVLPVRRDGAHIMIDGEIEPCAAFALSRTQILRPHRRNPLLSDPDPNKSACIPSFYFIPANGPAVVAVDVGLLYAALIGIAV